MGEQALGHAWRHVWGFSGYVISDEGVVKSKDTGITVEPSRAKDGCTTVVLMNNSGVAMVKKVCRLVVDSFDWVSEGYTPISHIDGDKTNDSLYNIKREIIKTGRSAYLAETEKPKKTRKPSPPRVGQWYTRGRVRIVQTGVEYESAADLCRALDLDHSTVSKILRGVGAQRTYRGMTFEYTNHVTKPYVLVNETGEIYYSVRDLCIAKSMDPTNVRKMLNGKSSQKTYFKMTFSYISRDDPRVEGKTIHISDGAVADLHKGGTGGVRPIRIVETGQVFESQIACARAIGASQSNIGRCLRFQRYTHMGYHYEYAD